jgi:hypothetical protein
MVMLAIAFWPLAWPKANANKKGDAESISFFISKKQPKANR